MRRLYGLFARWRRPRRMRKFEQLLPPSEQAEILDVGGTAEFWEGSGRTVTLLNLRSQNGLPGNLRSVEGTATSLPFEDNSFDIVFSNSMIEHLYTREAQEQAAREAMRVGERLWVQTPNYWFPIEPHYLTPFIHWLPKRVRKALARNFTLWGLFTRPDQREAEQVVDEIRLLREGELKRLFPGCTILRERFLGLTKSFIVVR